MKNINIVVSGVGGQGTLLASRVLARVLMDAGLDVKVSEVHGMAQRGGSVVTFVRAGEKVFSPLIHPGQADFLVSFEKLEALRWIHMLGSGKTLISADTELMPSGQNVIYPEDIETRVASCQIKALWIQAVTLAQAAGNQKAMNTVLLGALAATMDLPVEHWLNALKIEIPEKLQKINFAAFDSGWRQVKDKAS